jgi:DNA-binding response OmpR family regulator
MSSEIAKVNKQQSRPILVAIPQEWQAQVHNFLENKGFSVLTASSREEALSLLQSQNLSGIVMSSDWEVDDDEDKIIGLIERARGRIPTVTLITQQSFRDKGNSVYDAVYAPPRHDVCTVPFDPEELLSRMRRAGMISTVD